MNLPHWRPFCLHSPIGLVYLLFLVIFSKMFDYECFNIKTNSIRLYSAIS